MLGSPQSDGPLLPEAAPRTLENEPGQRSALEEPELEAALQLLVERAQYITGATGAALALPQGNEMVCRASAGSCAPGVGARLQVRSGLTGESIARRQLLRCDNAESDPRVNLEACQALGIASIVVLPLLRRNGEVRGLFELFSDHPYAFEERDLIALERMADLTLTALDLAEQRHGSVPAPPDVAKQPEIKPSPTTAERVTPQPTPASALVEDASLRPAEPSAAQPALGNVPLGAPAPAPNEPLPVETQPILSSPALAPAEPAAAFAEPQAVPAPEGVPIEAVAPAPVPEAMRRVQKCASCGFPVSEGRTMCLDCERADREKRDWEKKEAERKRLEKLATETKQSESLSGEKKGDQAEALTGEPDEILPPFLANSVPGEESWLANHVNLLAILVLIVGILVAIVVFR